MDLTFVGDALLVVEDGTIGRYFIESTVSEFLFVRYSFWKFPFSGRTSSFQGRSKFVDKDAKYIMSKTIFGSFLNPGTFSACHRSTFLVHCGTVPQDREVPLPNFGSPTDLLTNRTVEDWIRRIA